MELNRENTKRIFLMIVSVILFYTCVQNFDMVISIILKLLAYFAPLIAGCIIAFLLNVPMNFIENGLLELGLRMRKRRKSGADVRDKRTNRKFYKKVIRITSIILTIVLVFGAIMLVVLIIAPELSRTFMMISDAVHNALSGEGSVWIEKIIAKFPEFENMLNKINFNWDSIIESVLDYLKSGVGNVLDNTINKIGSLISGVLNFVLGFVFSLYILIGKERIGRQGKQVMYAVFREDIADSVLRFLKITNIQFSNFITGQCLDALLIGVMFFAGMNICGYNYSLLISVVIGFTAIIPVFGSTIGCVFAILILVIDNPVNVIGFIILFIIIQQFDESVVYPNVVGNSVGLPPIWALAAVILGGSMMGVAGMLIFIPLGSVVYVMISSWTKERLTIKGIDENKWKKTEVVLTPVQMELLRKKRKRFIKDNIGKIQTRRNNRKTKNTAK